MLSLRARLGLSAAVVVAAVVGVTSFLQTRIVGRTFEAEAVDAAAAIALGVAADLGEHPALPTTRELEDLLADYRKAVPKVRSITVTSGGAGPSVVIASTEAPPPPRAFRLGEETVARGEPVSFADGPVGLHFVGVPLEHQHRPYGAVVVAVGMDALQRLRRQSRTAAVAFAGSAIVLLSLGLDFVGRRLVHRPLAQMRATMTRAAAGDLAARAPVGPRDEIGELAAGLNTMLERMSDFNETLRGEVERATGDLREANRQLMETAQRLFAARRELAHSQQLALAGQVAASVAHQIGTPLNLISGYVQMLRAELETDAPAAQRLGMVQEQIGRVTAIVQTLLDRTRRPAPVRRPVAAGQVLAEVAELARPTLEAAGIGLEVQVAPGLPAVGADPAQIEQVFLSLIANAIDAMPSGGHLTLRACGDGDAVLFAVSDTGSGIAPEDLARVFEPLFTTKPAGRGAGLGLPIVREIVGAHGGSVRLESRPGEGTAALVRLPRAEQA